MRLTTFSDYTLRVLIYLGLKEGERSTVEEIARAYGISRNHLTKVVHHLAQAQYVETTRGKGGGMRLGRAPEEINIGALVRATEDNHKLVECFDRSTSDCRIEPACALRGVLGGALEAFFCSLDQYTLADLLVSKPKLARLLALEDRAARRG